jgi:3D (Asp-Asp-Asp) domain-containing protein
MLSGSLWRKALMTLVVAGAFVWLYEATILDSLGVGRRLGITESDATGTVPTRPGVRLPFTATAYCKGHVTAAGVAPRRGVAAGDPTILPLGTIVEVDAADPRIDGIYSILDTGPAIQGRRLDLYMWSCHDALKFGRQTVRLTVMRLGWNPRATSRSLMDRLLKRAPPDDPDPEPEPIPVPPAVLPSRPLTLLP